MTDIPVLTRDHLNHILDNPMFFYAEFKARPEHEKEIIRVASSLRIAQVHYAYYNEGKYMQYPWWDKDGKSECAKKIEKLEMQIDLYFSESTKTVS